MTGKHILAIVAIIVLVAAFAIPAQQVVICKDGRRLTGEVTKIEDGYRILMKGVTLEIREDQVLKIEDVVTPKDELAKRLEKVDSRDADGYYQAAKWAYDQNLLDETQKILLDVLKLQPDHENATVLLTLVKIRRAGPAETGTTKATTSMPDETPPPLDPSNFLKQEDIYRIRLMELNPDDKGSIRYRNDVLNRFIKSMRGTSDFAKPDDERRFRRYPKVKQVLYILDNTDRENSSIRDDILIEHEPQVMKDFKVRVWPIIARSYASPNCYGGVKVRDGLKLFNVPLTDERIAYTNFYILHTWERGGRKMINRDNPEMSLLLQYGLPKKLAKIPAPDYVPGPIFTSKEDRKYKLIEEWIESLRRPFLSPGYRIDYKLPGQNTVEPEPPATKPAGK